jgi:hypothetical protein
MELKEIEKIRGLTTHIESVQEQLETIEDMKNDDKGLLLKMTSVNALIDDLDIFGVPRYVYEEILNITETELRKELEFYETELEKIISG